MRQASWSFVHIVPLIVALTGCEESSPLVAQSGAREIAWQEETSFSAFAVAEESVPCPIEYAEELDSAATAAALVAAPAPPGPGPVACMPRNTVGPPAPGQDWCPYVCVAPNGTTPANPATCAGVWDYLQTPHPLCDKKKEFERQVCEGLPPGWKTIVNAIVNECKGKANVLECVNDQVNKQFKWVKFKCECRHQSYITAQILEGLGYSTTGLENICIGAGHAAATYCDGNTWVVVDTTNSVILRVEDSEKCTKKTSE